MANYLQQQNAECAFHLIKILYVLHFLFQTWHMLFDGWQPLHEISKTLDVCLLVFQKLKDNKEISYRVYTSEWLQSRGFQIWSEDLILVVCPTSMGNKNYM